MKTLSSAAQDMAIVTKAERNRRWPWCRMWNGFLDNPMLRVVAEMTRLPLYQVQAVVARLESCANAAEPRGYVGDFSAAEFGAAHGMPADEAARIFAALSHADVRWIEQDFVGGFHDRNRDREEAVDAAATRQRRSRNRVKVRQELARRASLGLIDADMRDGIEAMLELLSDEDLAGFKTKLKTGVAVDIALSTCHSVTAVARALLGTKIRPIEFAQFSDLSTGQTCHNVTSRDSVTVTPRADQIYISPGPVDNSEPEPGAETAGLSTEQAAPDDAQSTEAEAWLASEGVRIVVERLTVPVNRATMLIERWRRDLRDDACAMVAIIAGADGATARASHFQVSIEDQVKRHIVTRTLGTSLPLGPVQLGPATRAAVATPAAPSIEAADEQPDEERKRAHG